MKLPASVPIQVPIVVALLGLVGVFGQPLVSNWLQQPQRDIENANVMLTRLDTVIAKCPDQDSAAVEQERSRAEQELTRNPTESQTAATRALKMLRDRGCAGAEFLLDLPLPER